MRCRRPVALHKSRPRESLRWPGRSSGRARQAANSPHRLGAAGLSVGICLYRNLLTLPGSGLTAVATLHVHFLQCRAASPRARARASGSARGCTPTAAPKQRICQTATPHAGCWPASNAARPETESETEAKSQREAHRTTALPAGRRSPPARRGARTREHLPHSVSLAPRPPPRPAAPPRRGCAGRPRRAGRARPPPGGPRRPES